MAVCGRGQGGSPSVFTSYLKTSAESDELGAGSATGGSADPAKFWMGHPTPVAPTSNRKGCPLLCGEEEEGRRGEAHFATVSPGVLKATPGAVTTSPLPQQWNLGEPRRRPRGAVTTVTAWGGGAGETRPMGLWGV